MLFLEMPMCITRAIQKYSLKNYPKWRRSPTVSAEIVERFRSNVLEMIFLSVVQFFASTRAVLDGESPYLRIFSYD